MATQESGSASADRLTMFVDAVIAIALTLLALDLRVPTGDTVTAMATSVLDHRGEYLAFVLSFVVIAAHWRAHHDTFRHVGSVSPRLTSLTLVWLFMQVVMPFATRVITAEGAFAPRFSLYAIVQVLASATLALIIRQIRRERLYRGDVPPEVFSPILVRSICLASVFAVSVPVSFFTTNAFVCWLAIPVVLTVARMIQSDRADRRAVQGSST
ncbi:TMEM175 family protein [Kutzneria sp. 744]|jgi:uncharacterized membrane protein|uniref:TMEM175 family protein n=1 Tax=Kutzneria sp. (strain 744) TaxID=345341 RepID=UPI0003EEA408|nr:TMEM175 family protein [Kutzneria sp. 744]EWM16188.1 membrane protein [Kutzneria sp. 744]